MTYSFPAVLTKFVLVARFLFSQGKMSEVWKQFSDFRGVSVFKNYPRSLFRPLLDIAISEAKEEGISRGA